MKKSFLPSRPAFIDIFRLFVLEVLLLHRLFWVEAFSKDSSFDFSSKQGWEEYYNRQGKEALDMEWHSSISLNDIAEMVPEEESLECLMVGCGTSHLPDAVLQKRKGVSITLLDSSSSCINQLQQRYGNKMKYVCGDATRMSTFLSSSTYDMILDKGLMDALFCGEGWDHPIQSLLLESANILKPGGSYLLLGYRLMSATKDFLEQTGELNGLQWKFDCEGSTERVMVSIARKANEGFSAL